MTVTATIFIHGREGTFGQFDEMAEATEEAEEAFAFDWSEGRLIEWGDGVHCVQLGQGERRYDIGTPLTYYRAFADFALADPENGPAFADYLRSRL